MKYVINTVLIISMLVTQAQFGYAGAKGAAGGAKVMGMVVSAASGAVAVVMAKECYTSKPTNIMACASAVSTMATSAQSLMGSQDAGNTESELDNMNRGLPDCSKPENSTNWMCKGFETPDFTTATGVGTATGFASGTSTGFGATATGTGGPASTTTGVAPDMCLDCNPRDIQNMLNDAQGLLTKAGVQVSPDGSAIRMPDGKTGRIDQLVSASDAEQIKNAINAGINQRTGGKLNEIVAGGTGGSSIVSIPNGGDSSGGGTGSSMGDSSFDFKMPGFGVPGQRGLAGGGSDAFAGLAKPLGDDKIGVAGDNIFRMINRAYVRIGEKNEFLP